MNWSERQKKTIDAEGERLSRRYNSEGDEHLMEQTARRNLTDRNDTLDELNAATSMGKNDNHERERNELVMRLAQDEANANWKRNKQKLDYQMRPAENETKEVYEYDQDRTQRTHE